MIKDRLSKYLKFKHFSIREFERRCGIGQSVLSKISDTVSEDTLRKIEDNSDLNLDWLLSGKGNMIDSSRPISNNSHTNIGAQANGVLSTAIRDIKIDVKEQTSADTSSNYKNRKRTPSASELQKEIDRLNKAVSDAALKIANLEGRIEQQNETIKLLAGK